MAWQQVLEIMEALDRPDACAARVARIFEGHGISGAETETVRSRRGSTSFFRLLIPGVTGRRRGRRAPTLGIIGFLGGVGARPGRLGLVSDADGAVVSLAAGLKLADMARVGDRLPGDVLITTHVSPASPVIPHEPVPFMSSPLAMSAMTSRLVDPEMEAILSFDTTKGNRIVNHGGFAISPTVKQGYILRVSEDLLSLQQHVTGRLPAVFTVTMQDITPYGNGVYHLNSILQPATRTKAPVVGVALTSETAVPGCATGANQAVHLEAATRFAVEVAKAFGGGLAQFHDETEFRRLVRLYGSMSRLQEPEPWRFPKTARRRPAGKAE